MLPGSVFQRPLLNMSQCFERRVQRQKGIAGQRQKHLCMKAQSAEYFITKHLFSVLFLLVLLAAGACSDQEATCLWDDAQDDPSITTIAGTWKVIAYEDLAYNIRTVKDNANSPGGLDVVLTFEGDRISGKSTTNQVNGRFSYTGTRQVRIDEYGGTEVGEPAWGRMFGEAVFKFKEFTLNNGTLTFFYNNGQNAVILEKQ